MGFFILVACSTQDEGCKPNGVPDGPQSRLSMQEAKTRLQGIIQKRVLATRGNNFTIKEGYPLTVKLSSTPHNTPRRAGNNDSSLAEPVDSIIEYCYTNLSMYLKFRP